MQKRLTRRYVLLCLCNERLYFARRAFHAYGGEDFLQADEFLVSDTKKKSIKKIAAERTKIPREFSEKVEAAKEIQAIVSCIPGTTWRGCVCTLPSHPRTSA
eukprot:767003-Hanusia_phi.AAC.5